MSQGRSDEELLIQEYIREKTRLEGMSEIHTEFTGQDRSFSTWDGVVDIYEDMDSLLCSVAEPSHGDYGIPPTAVVHDQ
jgi:hypothetical protein